ncbi:MAG TPA: FkbM family methyltransferase [Chitinophagaceae bacterium]|nr:FkbM family methyltransferase [Chitinophagaceae bacterium]
MFNTLKQLLGRSNLKNTFKEYGFYIDSFDIEGTGKLNFAQWEHPFAQPFIMSKGNIDFYRQFIKPGDFVIDIGAHTGDTTVPMAVAAGKGGTVLALEPNKYVFRVLEENAKLNREYTHIIPLCMAATAEDGIFSFNYSDASFCNGGFLTEREKLDRHHKYKLDVEGKNLENILTNSYAHLLPKLKFIKVDAEGYDKEILKTLSGIISTYRPVILSECNVFLTKKEREELYGVMSRFGYKLYKIEDAEDRASVFQSVGSLLTMEDMHKEKHFDILARP